ncbi:YcaO-like family protein [Motilimonas eburnea]|uniref:YcaO-like family protein n=1 Tax=Motilimonas eburnea TaxID=1737488 RepID=UPI001E4B2219|nr:YcaO-like family protein [Motilimonas eburnea]MCE2571810.1 YcaO-like family protein [Motilimonas eburnea]
MKRVELIFYGVPIVSFIYNHPSISNLIIVDSTAAITIDKKTEAFHGHSEGYDEEKCIKISSFEILERMLSHECFFSPERLSKGFEGRCYYSGLSVGFTPASNILIRQFDKDGKRITSANGLAIHEDRDCAIVNALFEVIERHLLCEAWYYEKGLYLIDTEYIAHNQVINYYIINESIPFVIACFICDERVYFGSSVRSSINEAMEKSKAESLHLYCNFCVNIPRADHGNNNESLLKLNRIFDFESSKILLELDKKIRGTKNNVDRHIDFNANTILENTFSSKPNISIYDLFDNEGLYLCRVRIAEAEDKLSCRRKFSRFTIEDPFC